MSLHPVNRMSARCVVLGLLSACIVSAASPAEKIRENFRRSVESSMQRQQGAIARQLEAVDRQQAVSKEVLATAIEKQRASIEGQLRSARPERPRFILVAPPRIDYSPRAAVEPGCERIPASTLQTHINRVARQEGLLPDLLRVVIDRESSSWPCAVSPKGAMGLMQLMPGTAYDLGVNNPFDVRENIVGGARYLKYLLRRFGGDLPLALAAYNAGPTTVDTHQAVPPIPETQHYVADIVSRLNGLGPE